MRGIFGIGVVAAIGLSVLASAQAQTLTTLATTGRVPPMQQTAPNQRPAFHAFGMPVVVSTPVAPPYRGGLETFAGQPMTGKEAVLSAGG